MSAMKKGVLAIGDYQLGDLVMAKLGGHPYWPAEIRKCHQQAHYLKWKLANPDRLWCHFIDDESGNWVDVVNVRKYQPRIIRRWKMRVGPYVKSQAAAIKQATEIYERRAARGPDDPGTPPPEPEMVAEEEEEVEVEEPPSSPPRASAPKRKSRRKSSPGRAKNSKASTRPKRRATVHRYDDRANTDSDSDGDEEKDEKYDEMKKSTVRESNENSDIDDEILAVLGTSRADYSKGGDDEDSECGEDSAKGSGSDGSRPNMSRAAKTPADRIQRMSSPPSDENEGAGRRLSKRVSGTPLSARLRRTDNTHSGDPKSSSPDVSKTPPQVPNVLPSYEAARKRFQVSSRTGTDDVSTPKETTPAPSTSSTPSTGDGSPQHRRKSRFAPAEPTKPAKEDAFAPPAEPEGDIGSPLTALRTGTPPAPPKQYDDASPAQDSPGTKIDDLPSSQVEAPSAGNIEEDGSNSCENRGEETIKAGKEKDGNFNRHIANSSASAAAAASAQPSVTKASNRSPSPMDVSNDCFHTNGDIQGTEDKRASEITIRSTVTERIDTEGEMREKQAAYIEVLPLETRGGMHRCPVDQEEKRRAQFSQKNIEDHIEDRVSRRQGLRNSTSLKPTSKLSESVKRESTRRKRAPPSDESDGSENNDGDTGETEFRGEKRKGSPLVSQGKPKRARIGYGGENVATKTLETEIERLRSEISKKDLEICKKDSEISEKDMEICKKDKEISHKGKQYSELLKQNAEIMEQIAIKNGLLQDYKCNPSKVLVDLPDWPEWEKMMIPADSEESTKPMSKTELYAELDKIRKKFDKFRSKVESSTMRRKKLDEKIAGIVQELAPHEEEIRKEELQAVGLEAHIARSLGVLFVGKISPADLEEVKVTKTVKKIVSSCKEMPQIYEMGTRLLGSWDRQRNAEAEKKMKKEEEAKAGADAIMEEKKEEVNNNCNGTSADMKRVSSSDDEPANAEMKGDEDEKPEKNAEGESKGILDKENKSSEGTNEGEAEGTCPKNGDVEKEATEEVEKKNDIAVAVTENEIAKDVVAATEEEKGPNEKKDTTPCTKEGEKGNEESIVATAEEIVSGAMEEYEEPSVEDDVPLVGSKSPKAPVVNKSAELTA